MLKFSKNYSLISIQLKIDLEAVAYNMSPILVSTIFYYCTLSNVVKASLNSSNCNSESFSAILNLFFIGVCSIYMVYMFLITDFDILKMAF